MIVPMKKVFLVVLEAEKREALKKLRKLGTVHLEELEGHSEALSSLKNELATLESAVRVLSDGSFPKTVIAGTPIEETDPVKLAEQVVSMFAAKNDAINQISRNNIELERLESWGGVNLEDLAYLKEKGVCLHLYEIPASKYTRLPEDFETIFVNKDKNNARFVLITKDGQVPSSMPAEAFAVSLPEKSTADMIKENQHWKEQVKTMDSTLLASVCKVDLLKTAIAEKQKQIEFENAFSGMQAEETSEPTALAWLTGYVPKENAEAVKSLSEEQKWGYASFDPTDEDPVPTKLKNNKLVSLIYPVTDFLGTVPGYTEYDISNWFLLFFCVFFGMIFGDGGYGLLIFVIALFGMFSSVFKKQKPSQVMLLLGLIGLSTMGWGAVTCTWFGLEVSMIPVWLQNLSVPALSNVTSAQSAEMSNYVSQNVQIFCFTLALIQLSIAHLKGIIRYIKSPKFLGELGSLLMLGSLYFVVLNMVVSAERFPLPEFVIPGVLSGFVLNFVFCNYEGNFGKGIAESAKNSISMLLGVVNVFSDIISYIRLWAVGLAGAAIAQTVNEMAGPMLGGAIIFMGILLLAFGHGLNMVLNVLSVVVHGVRLNTLEFSSHLGMSWSGFKYQPFSENTK